jgi:hypothetical protein
MNARLRQFWFVALVFLTVECLCASDKTAPLEILLPLARTAYQTNETIDLAVVRQSPQALAPGDLTLLVTGGDGSRLAFTFALPAVPAPGSKAGATGHFQHDRPRHPPGHYTHDV